jgi:hypothetical protein
VQHLTRAATPIFFFAFNLTKHWRFQKVFIAFLSRYQLQIFLFNFVSLLFLLFGVVLRILTNKAIVEIFKLCAFNARKFMLDVIEFVVNVFVFGVVTFASPSMH